MKKLLSLLLILSVCLCFAACGGTDTPDDTSEPPVTDAVITAPSEAETEAETPTGGERVDAYIPGEYYVFALERDGYRVAAPDFGNDTDGMITLNEDGTGTMLTGDIENHLTWQRSGDALILMDETSSIPIPAVTMIMSDGVLSMEYEGEGISYFAKTDADTSAIETISVDEYRAAVGG